MKRVIIIGASSGIGEGLACRYASQGNKVGIAARREDRLQNIAEMYPGNIVYKVGDIIREGVSGGIFRGLEQQLGGVDLVIYASGAGEQNTELDIAKELNTVRVNVEGFMAIATEAVDYFFTRKRKPGEIVPQLAVISSIASVKGLGRATSYSASKRFQVTYMEGLAQLAHKRRVKISFTTVLPGFVDTDFIKGRTYPMVLSKEYAIQCIFKAIEARKVYKVIDWKWGMVVAAWRLVPGFIWRRIKL